MTVLMKYLVNANITQTECFLYCGVIRMFILQMAEHSVCSILGVVFIFSDTWRIHVNGVWQRTSIKSE